ncbi:MAG: hypothetical protein MK116_12020 [Phycisphaerales bacterium]|nr:hypothetical protein [Phycisphaerales bacterium]
MRNPRRGLLHRLTAMILVVAMPLCCCIMNAAAGVSCCTPAEVVTEVAPSCCSGSACHAEVDTEATPEPTPCGDSDCLCCLKAPSTTFDWTPPVDTIGTPMPPCTPITVSITDRVDTTPNRCGWADPPPRPDDPENLRGHVVLQV